MSTQFPYGFAQQLAGVAANVPQTSNPAYTSANFLEFYPQFTGMVSEAILNQFIAMADKTVLQARWHESWEFGMALFTAHFVTLYLQTLAAACNPTATQVIAAAVSRGLQTSKSVGDVSVSYDVTAITNDLHGWANFKSTAYGVQFASTARMLGKAGSYIW